ncbi:hypothetical protein GCM10027590_46120 [Nocardiopsis nanhaiensis]
MRTRMGMILLLSPFSTAEGGDRSKIIGVFAAHSDQPRHPQAVGSGAVAHPAEDRAVRPPQPTMTGRDTRPVDAPAQGQASAARPTESVFRAEPEFATGLDHASPFPDSRQPAVVAERVKVERR